MSDTASNLVLMYLQRAANTRHAPSVLDAVMGEDWAEYKAGNARKALQIQYVMDQQRGRRAAGAGLAFRVGRQSPQAVVKLINKGGARDAQGLKAQMDYLEKDGAVVLQRSEALFGLDVDGDQRDLITQAWGLKDSGKSAYPMTSHFVVSFPTDTDPEAAARAGRAWAEQMFDSGTLGDRYDYYTADHRDTAHPHTHVVVSRRGLENGHWLKVSRRSLINYDSMRQLQVEVAADEGIILEATPRLARGVHARPVPDARIRAEAERRGPAARAPEHTEISAIATAATILEFSRQIESEGRLIEATPAVSRSMARIIALLREGHQVTARVERNAALIEELNDMSEQYDAARTAISQSFRTMDRDIADVDDPAQRVSLQRQTAELRREAALLLPDDNGLQSFGSPAPNQAYVGIRAEGGGSDADGIRRDARENADQIAQDAGLDPDEVAARYGQRRVSQGLVQQWRMLELEQRARTRRDANEAPETEDDARRAVDLAHSRITEEYRTAETRLAGLGIAVSEEGQSRQGDREALVADIEKNVSETFEGITAGFRIYDPTMDTTYSFRTFDEATRKADALGASRVQKVGENDETASLVNKVDGRWERQPEDDNRFEALVIARSLAQSDEQRTLRGVELAEAVANAVADLKSGTLSEEDEKRADAIVRDTLEKYGPQMRAALDRDDTVETPSYQSNDPEADRREADRFEQKRRADYTKIEREYGMGALENLRRSREEDDGLQNDQTPKQDARDRQEAAEHHRGRGHDDNGFGL